MMQRYMPLIFGLIYLNVAALLNVYFIISSSIRIATQEILFRKGIVPGPPQTGAAGKAAPAKGPSGAKADRTEREIPRAKPPASTKGKAVAGGTAAKPSTKSTTTRARDVAAGGAKSGSNGTKSGSNGTKPGTNGSKPGSNGSGGAKASTGSSTGAAGSGGGSKGRSRTGNGSNAGPTDAVEDEPDSAPKEHPRSKAKRERKAR